MFVTNRKVLKRKFTIVHYANVNFYPPVQNLLAELSDSDGPEVELITGYHYEFPGLRVVNPSGIFQHSRSKLLHYTWWILVLLWKNARELPGAKTLLYEANSFPALLLNSTRSDVWLHFHEYRRPDRMQLSFFELLSELEIRRLIKKPLYVSHVTVARKQLLLDEGAHPRNEIRVMWNCPRLEWSQNSDLDEKRSHTLVLVGALGKSTWYKEVMEAFECQNEYDLHVYGKDKFESTNRVKYCGWVDYANLPEILSRYRVGLVWYNGESENFTSGISNKIFEYIHCGLHVIVSNEMAEAKNRLLVEYGASVSFVDFKSEDWMKALSKCFQQDRLPNRKHHFRLCAEPLLQWIQNEKEPQL